MPSSVFKEVVMHSLLKRCLWTVLDTYCPNFLFREGCCEGDLATSVGFRARIQLDFGPGFSTETTLIFLVGSGTRRSRGASLPSLLDFSVPVNTWTRSRGWECRARQIEVALPPCPAAVCVDVEGEATLLGLCFGRCLSFYSTSA